MSSLAPFSHTPHPTCREILLAFPLKPIEHCLGRVAELVEAFFCTPKVVGLIPGQGTYLGYRFDPGSGHVQEATD